MRRLILIAVLAFVGARPRPANAGCGGSCPPWVEVLGAAIGVGLLGAYAYGDGYYTLHELRRDRADRDYFMGAVIFNGFGGAITVGSTVASIRSRSVTGTLVFAPLAIAHTTLLASAVWRINETYGPPNLQPTRAPREVTIFAATALASNAVLWSAGLFASHERPYSIAKVAVNGSLTAITGYLTYDFASHHKTPHAIFLGGSTVATAVLAGHGIYTLLRRDVDVSRAGVATLTPNLGDGRVGLAVAGRW